MIKDILGISLRYVVKRGIRSFLTMIQIMLGIATIALTFHLVFGIWDGIQELEEEMGGGIYLLNIVTEAPRPDGQGVFYHHHQLLTPSDLREMKEVYTIEHVSPADSVWQPLIRARGDFYRLRKLSYVSPEYQQILGVHVVEGGFFTAEDYEQRAPVGLISKRGASQIYPNTSPIGEEIEIYTHHHTGDLPDPQVITIIGVYDTEGLDEQYSALGGNQLLLPATLKRSLSYHSFTRTTQDGSITIAEEASSLDERPLIFDTIAIQIREGSYSSSLTALTRQIQDRFGEEHQVQLNSYQRFVEDFRNWARTISMVLSGFGFLIVIIGSTGILSTMMVGILERTNQIGLEKAMGAPKGFIFLRFTTEALLLSLGGGILGLFLAFLLTDTINQLGAFLPVNIRGGLHPYAMGLSLLVALFSGGLFSIYPALQAINLEPVEAIRHK